MSIDVQLCQYETLDAAVLTACEARLSQDERARLQSFRVAEARTQFLVGRALVRTAVSKQIGVNPAALEIAIGARGRPRFTAPPAACRYAFSLSHTTGLVVCAVSEGADVGVDVEHPNKQRNVRDFAKKVLTSSELEDTFSRPSQEIMERFLTYWTLKESYAKLRGEGLTIGFDKLRFDLSGRTPQLMTSPDIAHAQNCTFHFEMLKTGHCCALAVHPGAAITNLTQHWTVPML